MSKSTFPLDGGYRIEKSSSSVSLILEREGEVNPDTGKPKQIFDQWWYPNIKMTLKKYIDLYTGEAGSVAEILERLDKLEESIDEIKIIYSKVAS